MKKIRYISIAVLIMSLAIILSGCSSNKIVKKLTDKGYFANSYDDAILQTDIYGIISKHFENVGTKKKKAMLITIDGMRAEGLEYIMGSDLGISAISKDGGLYWTKPANLDTKAKIDIGVNFLSIVTGEEPSTFDVLKKTDAKREVPYSIMAKASDKYNVKFITDNKNYIESHLALELKAKASPRLSYVSSSDLNGLRNDCLNSISDNDIVVVATSDPYNVAQGNYSMGNSAYLSAILHLNYYITDIYEQVKKTNDDWLFIVATTCGGKSKLAADKEEGNILTFMFTNQKLV